MTPRHTRKPFSAAAGVVLLLAGCQSAQTTAAHKIADALPRSLGPAAHYDVQVEGDTGGLTRGRARRIHITGRQVQVAPDTMLDTLDLDARDVSVDTSTRRIEKVRSATFTGTVGQQNLTRYLTHRRPLVSGLTVQIRARDVLAVVPISVVGLHTSATLSGTLAPDANQPDHLDFVADAASLGIVSIPARLVNYALNEINPVFDLSQVRVPFALTRADIINDQIVLQGTANLDNFRQ